MNKSKIKNGYYLPATQKQSPNYCARPDGEIISLIVLHNISLPPFHYLHPFNPIEKLFLNQIQDIVSEDDFFSQLVDLRVSSHFFINRLGEIIQFVSCDDMAYHAGVSCFRGREKCNQFSIGIELEGCDFEPFSQAQYSSLNQLLIDLMDNYPIQAITGHQDIAPTRKTDPGHFFDWDKLQQKGFPIDRNQ